MKFGPPKGSVHAAQDWLNPPKTQEKGENYSQILRALISESFAGTLESAGFRKKNNNFNCSLDSGLVHQISFPAIRYTSSGYGKFQLHCGVYLPEASLYTNSDAPKNWVNDYHCCLRMSAGPWVIEKSSNVAEKVKSSLNSALLLLSEFRSREDFLNCHDSELENFQKSSRVAFFETPNRILKACIHLNGGRVGQAEIEIKKHLEAEISRHPSHAEIVTKWAREMNLKLPS